MMRPPKKTLGCRPYIPDEEIILSIYCEGAPGFLAKRKDHTGYLFIVMYSGMCWRVGAGGRRSPKSLRGWAPLTREF